MRTLLGTVAVAIAVAGCGASTTHGTSATAPPVPSSSAAVAAASPSSAPGAAFCARLKSSPKTVQVVYASEVERQVGLASGSGSVTPETIQAARTIVALWITISCPRYAYLEQHG